MRRHGGAKPKRAETPERERAALAAEEKKKSGPVKRTLHLPSAEAEPEPGEVVEDGERTNSEEPIKFQNKDPDRMDYVLVESAGKDRKRHYIGFIT